jgi:polyphosphate kinase
MNLYFDRDLSWLSFNYRVLLEATDPKLPLYERIKFLAIFSSNLDEFFKVRVASIQSLRLMEREKRKALVVSPKKRLKAIYEEVKRQQMEFGLIFSSLLLPELAQNGIELLQKIPQDPEQRAFIKELFEEAILPLLHPELLSKGKIRHFLRDEELYLAVHLMTRPRQKEGQEKERLAKARYAIMQIPTHYLSRFVALPSKNGRFTYMFLDDIIRMHLPDIFPGYKVVNGYAIKLSRNADLRIEDEFSGDLVSKIQDGLRKRQTGIPTRFLYDPEIPANVLQYFKETFGLRKREMMAGGRYHNFKDFFRFPNPLAPQLEREPTPPLPHPDLEVHKSLFVAIKEKSRLLHFPYQTYDYVIGFLNEAAQDPLVKKIQTTQYRIASGSAIVKALIRAAELGKEVRVFVELKARFDEAANLRSAQLMQAAGVQITHSIPGLKVHAKVALVEREEEEGLRRYAFLSTGNFNEKTARIYADHGYFTAHPQITNELAEVFRYLDNQGHRPLPFQRLLVAQFNMLSRFQALIDREIDHVRAGRRGYMLIKFNNLEEREMIDKLYHASQAGVEIDLIIRGICCLRPGVKGLSENIRVIRLVDQFLEHARVFVFHHNGADEMFLGSADWMTRNLRRRIEVVFPLQEPELKSQVMEILHMQLRDNVKAVRLNENLENVRLAPQAGEKRVRMQTDFYGQMVSL